MFFFQFFLSTYSESLNFVCKAYNHWTVQAAHCTTPSPTSCFQWLLKCESVCDWNSLFPTKRWCRSLLRIILGLSSAASHSVLTITLCSLQRRTLRPRKIEELGQGTSASEPQRCELPQSLPSGCARAQSFAAKDGEALYSQQKQDWELTVAQIMNSLLPNSDLN